MSASYPFYTPWGSLPPGGFPVLLVHNEKYVGRCRKTSKGRARLLTSRLTCENSNTASCVGDTCVTFSISTHGTGNLSRILGCGNWCEADTGDSSSKRCATTACLPHPPALPPPAPLPFIGAGCVCFCDFIRRNRYKNNRVPGTYEPRVYDTCNTKCPQ